VSSATTLVIEAVDRPVKGGTFANVLSRFDDSYDRVDLAGLAYVSGATAKWNGHELTLKDGSYVAHFELGEDRARRYVVVSDGHGGTLIRGGGTGTIGLAEAAASFDPLPAALSYLGGAQVGSAHVAIGEPQRTPGHMLA